MTQLANVVITLCAQADYPLLVRGDAGLALMYTATAYDVRVHPTLHEGQAVSFVADLLPDVLARLEAGEWPPFPDEEAP